MPELTARERVTLALNHEEADRVPFDVGGGQSCTMSADAYYDVSMAWGERILLPAVRRAGDALVLADAFSCCEQVEQATGRRPLHLA
jgi:hypothetical protein